MLENAPERFSACVIVIATGGSRGSHGPYIVTNSDQVAGAELRSTVGMQNDFARVAGSFDERHAYRFDDEVIAHVIINGVPKTLPEYSTRIVQW